MNQVQIPPHFHPPTLKFSGGKPDENVFFIVTLSVVVIIELLVLVNFFVENRNLQIANDIFLLLYFAACIFFLWENKFPSKTTFYYKFWLLTLFVATIRSPFFNPLMDRKNKWKYFFGGFCILLLSGAPNYLTNYVVGDNDLPLNTSNYPGIALSLLVIVLFLSTF